MMPSPYFATLLPRLHRNLVKVCAFALSLVLCCSWATSSGQSLAGQGALGGVVHDPSGASVEKAEITISNASIGITRKTVSTSGGAFEASSLPPAGGYKVTVKAAGFANYEATGIVVHVGEIASVLV